jgi:two-component system sensor histidine kinase VanS
VTRLRSGTYWQHRRLSARARLTLTFSTLLFVAGAAIVASVFVVMRYLPQYDITQEAGSPTATAPVRMSPAPLLDGTDSALAEPGQLDGDPPVEFFSTVVVIAGESDLLRVLLTTSLVVFVVVLAAGSWFSWVLAGRLLRPLDHLTDSARTAELGQATRRPTAEHERLALAGPQDEFHRLASAFDDMLERLDTAYRAQQRFAADASHELRTPLATTQAMLDVALAEPESVDVEQLGRRLRETNTRSLETVEALLTLADASAGRGDDRPVDVRALVTEAAHRVAPAASSAGTALDCRLGDVVVDGDRELVSALVVNLLENAVRHGRQGGRISVALNGRTLTVRNDGDVLEPDEVARLTGAFHRGRGRVSGPGGHGLGLAIVAAICDRHAARLELSPEPGGGLRVDVEFAAPRPDDA